MAGMKNKTFLVAQREYVENIRTKAFWIGIILFPIIITVAMVVPSLLERAKSDRNYAVIDESGWLLEEIETRAALPDLEKVFTTAVERFRTESEDFGAMPDELQQIARTLDEGSRAVGGEDPDGQVIGGYAALVAGAAGQGTAMREQLPPEAVAELDRLRDSIGSWWRSLPAEEAEAYGSGLVKSRYFRVPVTGRGQDARDSLTEQLRSGDLFAYFVIPRDPVQSDEGALYVSENLTDTDLKDWFESLASSVIRERRLSEREIDAETARWVQAPVDFAMSRVGKEGEQEQVGAQDRIRQYAPMAFVYLLWISVFTIAQMLLTNTIEEKSNRLMEVLLSSVSPLQLMVGKILGIAATGLTMLGSWMIFFYLATKFVPRLFSTGGGTPEFDLSIIAADPVYIASFLAYFLLGYLLYASILVAIGSVCNSLKEAQNLMSPVTLLLMVPLLLMFPITKDPNGLLAKVMSYFPPFTPFVMMNRAAGPPTTLEYVLTTLLLIVAVAAALWGAAKVFRIGVLMTGKAPKVGEILRWLRAPVAGVRSGASGS